MRTIDIISNKLFLPICLILLSKIALVNAAPQPGAEIQPDELFPVVEMHTVVGKIVVELDRYKAPITVNNFLYYVNNGSYDGTIFHRVEKEFVVQGGGYDKNMAERDRIKPIFNESGNGLKNEMFTIAMAREKDPHSAMRQFYFNMTDNEGLDPGKQWGYTVFGNVIEGEEVLELISAVEVHIHPQLHWENVPVRTILLKRAVLLPPKND
ncbi:MAG: peptidylprolyl isomerase [Kangiellaceae bacterium]|nr:peptidylprolyl isomerase [Kangiellaceae bacterium]